MTEPDDVRPPRWHGGAHDPGVDHAEIRHRGLPPAEDALDDGPRRLVVDDLELRAGRATRVPGHDGTWPREDGT